jgi:NAD(P)-dependent dehydrogenase (short-subunit alcohol dehydrogenase family)
MSIVVITGAASGLGLEFLRHYASIKDAQGREQYDVVALDRSPFPREVLQSNIETHQLDITNEAAIVDLAKKYRSRPISLLVHSAGIRGLVPEIENEYPDDVAKAETMDVMTSSTMLRTFHINTVGTFMLIRALLPNLKTASELGSQPKVVVMGSRMGSISYNSAGSAYAYRASKAALNAVMKSFSIDVPEVIFATLHPGRVETGLVKCREEGAIGPSESVEDMLKLMERLKSEDSGGYFDRFGGIIGW